MIGWVRAVLGLVFVLIVVLLLVFYWYVPDDVYNFLDYDYDYDYVLNGSDADIQFLPNMRFADGNVSYSVGEDCTLKKRQDVELAVAILENRTILDFGEVSGDADISVECSEKDKFDGDFFVAGEGGPVNVTRTKNFNVIRKGYVLLIRDSKCERPNVAVHEFLHALGFGHSDNPNNVMFPSVRCEQNIGVDIPDLIRKVYSVPMLPELGFANVSAVAVGEYLSVNLSIRNDGLKDADGFVLGVFSDGVSVKNISLNGTCVGCGHTLELKNVLLNQGEPERVEFLIESNFSELNKINNKIKLKSDESVVKSK